MEALSSFSNRWIIKYLQGITFLRPRIGRIEMKSIKTFHIHQMAVRLS